MKAVRLLEYGGQLVFNDVPTPTIARDEILVKIKSAAVNHLNPCPGARGKDSSRLKTNRSFAIRSALSGFPAYSGH